MQETSNYQLVKQELTDKADITQISGNWDKIDAEMKRLSDEKFDKAGGTITGATTINGALNATSGATVTGGGTVDTLTVQWGTTTDTLVVNGDATLNGKTLTNTINAISGSQIMNISVPKPVGGDALGFIIQWSDGTTPRVSLTHHPEKTSNDKQIATTNWVKSLVATTSEYGLVRLASENDALAPTDPLATVTMPLMYEVSDFRRISTAYEVGDKVACAFEYEYFLECTQAGTTSDTTLDTRNVQFGQVIDDGTVQWTVRAHIKSINGVVPDQDGNVEIQAGINLKVWG